MRYTINTASPTGKVDPTYGAEYSVSFNEDSREVKMNRKFPPKVGSELLGDIISASWGSYFKKDPAAGQQTYERIEQNKEQNSSKEHSFYVAYAKDLLIAYMSSLDWDFDKLSEEGFDMAVRLIATAAKTMESEV